tara:strand:+ start:241 stop:1011 length:771 start_codon:yes stop_codon:yes gene_type:complete
MLTVNDLIGLDFSKLRNPQPADMGPGLSYQVDPTAQGGRRLVNDVRPGIDRGLNSIFGPNTDPNIPEFAQVDMSATGTIPTAANINTQPLIAESGIAPILQQNMDYGTSVDNFQGFTDKEDFSTPTKKKSGLSRLLSLAFSLAVPGAGFLMNAPQGLIDLNRRLRSTDFARSKNLMDYLDARKYGGIDARNRAASQNMREARAIQKQLDLRTASGRYDDGGDRGRGQMPSRTPSAPKSTPRQSRQTSGIGGLHNYG